MPEKSNTEIPETNNKKEIQFKCKFCGKSKALSELVIMRNYHPQISACKDCARSFSRKD